MHIERIAYPKDVTRDFPLLADSRRSFAESNRHHLSLRQSVKLALRDARNEHSKPHLYVDAHRSHKR